ncbi:MAG: cupin domain-containing protein [Thermomicrobia bacterium]|nr:cupin domain-containing protein [Thermomicrobia bacterium]MCA1724659.1 cupin domain-containing protein [Thermomicrobia bacterium]
MSARASHADATRAFAAPDGIAILPFALPGLSHLSFVEGRIPPRPEPYPIHLHGALEQVTYVLAGRITVTTWDAEADRATTFAAAAGEAFVTVPLQTLAFANAGPEEARVLFICAPAYPPDSSDTRLVTTHHAPIAEEIAWSHERQQIPGANRN